MSACVGFIVMMWCIARVSANHQAVWLSLVEVRLLPASAGAGVSACLVLALEGKREGECRVLQKLENLRRRRAISGKGERATAAHHTHHLVHLLATTLITDPPNDNTHHVHAAAACATGRWSGWRL